jgi:hypothetical protein
MRLASTPEALAAPADRVVSVAVGARYGCALRQSGSVECWGAVTGATPVTDREPVRVEGITDAVELVAAGGIACTRSKSGAVACLTA